MRGLILGAVLAVTATAASAQTTKCGWELGKWVCRTTEPAQPYRFENVWEGSARGYELGAQMGRDIAAARNARRQAEQAAADEALAVERRRMEAAEIVRGYMAARRCEDARRVAYEYFGDQGAAEVAEKCPTT